MGVQALGTKVYASESKARVLRLAGVWEDALFTSDKEEVMAGHCRVRMAWLGQVRSTHTQQRRTDREGEKHTDIETKKDSRGGEAIDIIVGGSAVTVCPVFV
jgi:hypothetical protein